VNQRTGPAVAEPADDGLSAGSIGLPQALFQSVTHMGPAAGIASSLLVAISFAGPTMPLAIGLAMIVCLLIATAVAQLARHVTTAGGLADYVEAGLGPRAGRFAGWLYPVLELLIAPIVFMVLGQILAGVFDRDLGVTAPWWLWMIVAKLGVHRYRELRREAQWQSYDDYPEVAAEEFVGGESGAVPA